MKTIVLIVCALVLAGGLSGCKLVKTGGDGKSTAIAADETGDDARIAALVARTYADRLVPHVRATAVDAATLKSAVAAGLDEAGKKHGHRGDGEGAAWNFAVTARGRVIAADRASRAAHADLDVDGDGEIDLVVQLGPVVRGTALRDLPPFYNFTDFRDQIEFAKLGRALNDAAVKALKLPDGDLVGKILVVTGAMSLRTASDKPVLVPVDLEIAP